MADLPPVHFLSHGTTMLLGEDSRVRDYWNKIGRDATAHGVKGVILMGAHWWVDGGDKIKIAMNPMPGVMPVANVMPELWNKYEPNTDLDTGRRCFDMLTNAGFEVELDPERAWMIDVLPILVAMFPDGCPPTTIISLNSRFDPFQHARMGAVLRPLRAEGYMFVGSGGGVHNLYRTEWKYMLKYKDNFAMEKPPDQENLEFRTALEDVIVKNGGGPGLRRGLARLMKHPYFRDAHGSDEHYIPALFVAGAIGDPDDVGSPGILGAECWELRNQGETQFTIGKWSENVTFPGWKKELAQVKA